MKIRTQLVILVTGIVLIPIALLALYITFESFKHSENRKVQNLAMIPTLQHLRSDDEKWKKISELYANSPKELEWVFFDRDYRVLFSNQTEIKIGEQWSWGRLENYMRNLPPRYALDFQTPWIDEGYLLMGRFDRGEGPPDSVKTLILLALGMLGTLLIFATVLAVYIARSTTRAILDLEKATRHVAAGELDTLIHIKGNQEILSLGHSFNEMRLALIEEKARRARFIMGISHDLKSPLALIQGYLEAFEDGMITEQEFREHRVKNLLGKVSQLHEMIDDLIDYMNVDTGQWRQSLTIQPLAPVIKKVGKMMETDAAYLQRKMVCQIELPEDLLISFDPRYLQRSLENLLGNALRYTQPGQEIVLRAWQDLSQNTVNICVSDSGPGIAEKDLPYVFDPFYRGTSSRREPGMGLGLTIVKTLIQSHGWQIIAESKNGAHFTITMPLS